MSGCATADTERAAACAGPGEIGPVSPRIRGLLDDLLSTRTVFCFERARLLTESYRETEGEPMVLRRALALRRVFEGMPLFIRPGELLVGQRAAVLGGRSVYPEFHLDGLRADTTPAPIWEYWHGRTLGDIARARHPDALRRAEREQAAGFVTGTGTGYGHVIVDYEKALSRGFAAIVREARERGARMPAHDAEGRAFCEAVAVAGEGIIIWANRYAELAEREAAHTADDSRRAELVAMAETCRRVPAHPARTFAEALQSFWFVHLALHIEQYGWSISAGRFDRYMMPYLARDVEPGGPGSDRAWEMLLNLWVKFMENIGTEVRESTFQNLTLGGADAEGRDESNLLSHLCLDATVALGVIQPALSVRRHANEDPAFRRHVLHTLAAGLGFPALFNDDVVIPALVRHGVAPADASGYAIVGCVEASVPGKQQGMTAGGHINTAKALELALNDGCSSVTGERLGPATGRLGEFSSFDDVLAAYAAQVRHLADLNILAARIAGDEQKRRVHCPFMSSLLDDCLERGRDLVHGGTRYNLPGIAIYGASNACDGLLAIRTHVFENRTVTPGELQAALEANFEGYEPLRELLARKTPRFGNGLAESDAFANTVNAIHADYCWGKVDSRGGRFTCGVWPVTGHVHAGHKTGASPDGRRSGEPLVDGVGACQGADRNGPTALLRSVAALDHISQWPAGNTCNIKFPATAMRSDAGLRRLDDLILTFLRLGGQQLQVNVVDADTLRRAMEAPRDYPDLVVRVAGYSAYFTRLGRDVQNEILSRTEQALA